MPVEVPFWMPSRFSYSEGDGSCADTENWVAHSTAIRQGDRSDRNEKDICEAPSTRQNGLQAHGPHFSLQESLPVASKVF
jgi:hypothetical protein